MNHQFKTFVSRTWQDESFDKIDAVYASGVNRYVPVNACVGSGKTAVASYAIGKFIALHSGEKTVSLFVCPRIKLCAQQNPSLASDIESMFGFEDKKNGLFFHVKNCENKQLVLDDVPAGVRHMVITVCDETLWGNPKNSPFPDARWAAWNSWFDKLASAGYKFGCIAYDEAHNYKRQFEPAAKGLKGKIETLMDRFAVSMPLSGTPCDRQIEIYNRNVDTRCECPPWMAVLNKWICRPVVNLVKCGEDRWPNAVKTVVNREIQLHADKVQPFKPHILVNCRSRAEVNEVAGMPYFKSNAGKKFHVVTILSPMEYDDDGIKATLEPTVDGKPEPKVYDKYLAKLDGGTAFSDDLPVVVMQVQMIGEGINIKSFTSTITSAHNNTSAMQQMGRVLRNYVRNGVSKIDSAQANVYVIEDNLSDITGLLEDLIDKREGLAGRQFDWGKKIDIRPAPGETEEDAEKHLAELPDCGFSDITDEDEAVIRVTKDVSNMDDRLDELAEIFCDGTDYDGDGVRDIDEFEELMKSDAVKPFLDIWKIDRNKAGFARNAFKRVMDIARAFLSNDANRTAFMLDERATFACMFLCPALAEFLDEHLPWTYKEALAGTMYYERSTAA